MNIFIVTKNYQQLLKNMRLWQKAYDEGDPILTDEIWDNYYWELIQMEKMLGYADPESPTQRIIYEVKTELQKVEHSHPMLSLDKTKDIEEIKSFISEKDWICMAKMDGLTCSLTYRGGRLVRAETRGNGLVGEDVTHNAYVIPSIPKAIPIQDEVVIDGEIICTYNDFRQFATDYSNPRNFASGSIRLLDNKECEKRHLTFIAWDWIQGTDRSTLSEKLMYLQNIGFTTVPWRKPAPEYGDTLEDIVNAIKNRCQTLGYPIDGLVFKYDLCEEYEAAGRTDHHFKGGLAYKFYDELYDTRLINIEWSMGRTGVLTPVAIYEDVDTGSNIISRASLHNLSILNLILGRPYKGQKIKVYLANQIIPQIAEAEKLNKKEF